ncbi:UMP kinase [Phreatobacter stygius]|uniref:Uridylate kinase n=1 Tax=Phreatobacter stygius TaxID=1940610 RepID=A0A4D7BCW1_9HYPH|nr:UMP kinase [Phreatobacter stygius]QCI68433.1 UMP kinase [Phreatobacter stygius]
MAGPRYTRALVKISGEALAGTADFGFDPKVVRAIAEDLIASAKAGIDIAVVVGGGNIFRGKQIAGIGLSRVDADAIGRLATVMNAITLAGQIQALGHPAVALSAEPVPEALDTYTARHALDHLAQGRIVVLGGGIGVPLLTTDTTAIMRAVELNCGVVLKGTNVDGIYSADPKKDPKAVRFDALTADEAIARDLKVMDTAAFALARENRLPIIVFSLDAPNAVTSVLTGTGRCTVVTS